MQLVSVAFVALWALLVRAAPKTTVTGATYSLTNVPGGNNVIIHAVGSDGMVTYSGAISTGGKGAHGIEAAVGPDGLFGQGSVTVFENNLYVVNPGSNTFTWFKINPQTPTSLTWGGSYPSGGEFPTSIAVSGSLRQLCVLNGGKINGVQCYTITPSGTPAFKSGAFRSLGLTQTTPATGPSNSSSSILFTSSSSYLLVDIKGNIPTGPAGYMMAWSMSSHGDMASTYIKTPAPSTGGLAPFGMVTIPNTQAVIAADPGAGASIYDYSTSPPKTSSIAFPGEMASCWAIYSKSLGTYFFSDPATSTIFEASVNSKIQGSYIGKITVTTGSAPLDMAVGTISGKDYLYFLEAGTSGVGVISLLPNGQSKQIQSASFLAAAEANYVPVIGTDLQGMAIYLK